MDNLQIRQIIKDQLSNIVEKKSTTSFNASQNDPSKSCTGRGVCCIDIETKVNTEAPFKMDYTKRVICRCPQGSRKIMCEK
jgi:hypothetical protein